MASIIETIKAKVDVAEEIGLVVTLQKSGKALKGLCPFHNERTGSFYVFPETQTWHCFGCNEGGDVFSFVQKQQGLEFRETLQYLAEKVGVQIEEQGDRDPEVEREANATRERLRKLNEDALLWFHQMLLRSKEAAEARAYVQSRGISSDTALSFALGYAPDQWDGLSHYLLKQGYTERELVVGGLAREREEKNGGMSEGNSGGVYDYFRNRLIFPIRDIRGRVIGFGGRALGEGKPKYLNSPQTLLFEKNSVLYAIDMARDAIKQAHQVVIVEGYVDAVIAHQCGTRQTVACIGSAITEKHIQQLKKLTRQVTLALDPDAAGSAATEHGIQEALSSFDRVMVPIPLPATGKAEGKRPNGQAKTRSQARQQLRGVIRLEEQLDAEINVMMLPDGKDPDEVIQQDLPAWLYAVSHPLALVDYYFKTKTADLNLREPMGQTEAAKRLLPIIGMVDHIKRDPYIRNLASITHIEERVLHEELQRMLRGHGGTMLPPAKTSAVVGWQEKEKDEPEWISNKGEEAAQAGSASKKGQPWQALDRNRDNKLQWEDYLIGLLVQNPALISHVCVIINDGDFVGTDTRELYHILNSVYHRASSPSTQPFEQFVPSELLTTVARVQKCVESGTARDGAGLVKEAVQCATRLKRTRLLQLNTELKYLLDEAYRAGNTDSMRQLMKQQSEVDHQLRTIDTAVSSR